MSAYYNKNKQPIRIDDRVAADIIQNANEVLGIYQRGAKIIFPDVQIIYATLKQQLEQQKIDK